ncbi:glycine betaine/choline ABC transporter [Paenibacillus pini JCM 16418]|uniref:Glycine betaine/choline ABC transporter n=1 Tax=Paenibacillus pini JCM 16418 TaxID=1236976 RepID=W7Y9G3_9BACL|nr:glycine betaine/choline ABC transporter [Paenibacillus pini JCM 16418]
MIGITAVLQTIPSLALLGLLIPLFGIGRIPAIIALVVYALLPISEIHIRVLKKLILH